eukprot:SAG31_NODE_16152_length_721_cov_0.778135_1_plen_240_part_11
MLAQIVRMERVVDECCGPTLRQLTALVVDKEMFGVEGFSVLEQTHPEIVAQMLPMTTIMEITEDGSVTSKLSGSTLWLGTKSLSLTAVFAMNYHRCPTAASMILGLMASAQSITAPYCKMLPDVIMRIIGEDASSNLAENYRRYVRVILLPRLQMISQILQTHGTIIDLPPVDWLTAKFPSELWATVAPPDIFICTWFAGVRQWERLVSEWDEGNFGNQEPCGYGSAPSVSGLMAMLEWS